MSLIGLAVLCVLIGAVGTEMLHAWRPKLVERVEGCAKKLADSMCSSKAKDTGAKTKHEDS